MDKKVSFRTYLKIDKSNLNSSMAELATHIYNFGLKQAKLEDELLKCQLKLEITESKIAGSKRVALSNINRKKAPTETTIKNQVNYHPEIIDLKENIIKLKSLLRLAKLKNKTLYVKKDMIENISHNIREEKKSCKNIKLNNHKER